MVWLVELRHSGPKTRVATHASELSNITPFTLSSLTSFGSRLSPTMHLGAEERIGRGALLTSHPYCGIADPLLVAVVPFSPATRRNQRAHH